jgi:hypothetical protein
MRVCGEFPSYSYPAPLQTNKKGVKKKGGKPSPLRPLRGRLWITFVAESSPQPEGFAPLYPPSPIKNLRGMGRAPWSTNSRQLR